MQTGTCFLVDYICSLPKDLLINSFQFGTSKEAVSLTLFLFLIKAELVYDVLLISAV